MKKGIFITFILCLILVNVNVEVQASSGKLKSASICQAPNGVYYGQHSSDNHWHLAVKKSNGWYAQGGIVSANPCSSGGTNTGSGSNGGSTGSSNSGSSHGSNSNGGSTGSSNSSNSNKNNTFTPPASVKSNEKPVIKSKKSELIKTNKIEDYLDSNDILELFDVKVTDKEDGKISNEEIVVKPNKIFKDDIGEQEIIISYKDKDGNEVKKTLILTIKEDGKPKIKTGIEDEFITIDSYDVPKNIDELIEFLNLEVIDEEDGLLDITEKNISIDNEKHILSLTFEDSDGNKVSKDIEYEIEEVGFIDAIIGMGFLGLIVYGGYVLYKKFRK